MPVMRETNMTLEQWGKRSTELKHEGRPFGDRLAEVENDLVWYNSYVDLNYPHLYKKLKEEHERLLSIEKKYKKLKGIYNK